MEMDCYDMSGRKHVPCPKPSRFDPEGGIPGRNAGFLKKIPEPKVRTFATGATRDQNTNKPDYKGFLSPYAIRRFGEYMMKHQKQSDGTMRASDNWKKGIPLDAYTESLIRHMVDFHHALERGDLAEAEELACAIWFNVQGFLHERIKARMVGSGREMTPEAGEWDAVLRDNPAVVVDPEPIRSDSGEWRRVDLRYDPHKEVPYQYDPHRDGL